MNNMPAMRTMSGIVKMVEPKLPGAIDEFASGHTKRTQAQQVKFERLPKDSTETDLYALCSPFGAICPQGVKVMRKPEGLCMGTGWVDFMREEDANIAVRHLNEFCGLEAKTLDQKKGVTNLLGPAGL